MYYIIFCIEKNREHLWTIFTLVFFTPPPKIVDNSDFELLKYLPPPGVPEYNIPPFDPWYAEEVNQVRSGYKLKLKHVKEGGWQQSTITKFRWETFFFICPTVSKMCPETFEVWTVLDNIA